MANPTPPASPGPEEVVENRRSKPNLTPDQVKQVVSALLVGCSWDDNNRPVRRRGILRKVGQRFGLSQRQLKRIWARAKANHEDPVINSFRASLQKKGKSGWPRIYDPVELQAAITDVPLSQKTSLRKLAGALDMPYSTLFSLKKRTKVEDDPIIHPHTSAIKPSLPEMHELARMMFACSRLECTSGLFDDCLQEVHVDEKWFF